MSGGGLKQPCRERFKGIEAGKTRGEGGKVRARAKPLLLIHISIPVANAKAGPSGSWGGAGKGGAKLGEKEQRERDKTVIGRDKKAEFVKGSGEEE